MIFEYAVDPAVVREWQMFRHLADGFAFSRGRVIARYPKDWTRMVYAAIGDVEDNTKKKIVTWLADRAKAAITANRAGALPYTKPTWFENAIAEHARLNFHAIISDQADSTNPPVLLAADIDETKSLWRVSTQAVVDRNAQAIGACVAPLLAHATILRFIDPYFMADPDQVDVLLACLSQCVVGGRTSVTAIEIHVDGEKVKSGTEKFILAALKQKWPQGLPAVAIIRWRSGYLHNRFVLTDRGGVALGDSLREHPSRPDQVTLLEEGARSEWWGFYDAVSKSMHLAP